MFALLDNITWHTLAGPHARFAAGAGGIRRYAAGFSPILGFRDPANPELDVLSRFCEPGEHFYCETWSGPAPAGWQVEAESTMFKMVWDPRNAMPEDDSEGARPLGTEHAAQALALAELTRPGPFGPRTVELGDYFGYFDEGRLVAMAGERMHAATLREISGVCTHPEHRGRGLARRLMLKLARRQLLRGELPFLHVMRENVQARSMYERMGFRNHRETVVRVISRST